MISLGVLALAASSVNADFVKTQVFSNPNCAGSPVTVSGTLLNCVPVDSSGLYRSVSCTGSNSGNTIFYTTSDCTGTPASTSPINSFSSCQSQSGASSQTTCATGNWVALASSVTSVNYPSSPSCPQTTIAESASSVSTGLCLIGSGNSFRYTCTSSTYSFNTYSSSDCSGSIASTNSFGLGCASASTASTGVNVVQCTSGTSSSTLALASIVLMIVAAASSTVM